MGPSGGSRELRAVEDGSFETCLLEAVMGTGVWDCLCLGNIVL